MSMGPADRILQSAKSRVPGVTDPTATLELFNAIDEFLRYTMAWREESPIVLHAGLEYDLPVPAGASLVRIIKVTHNGIPVAAAGSSGITQSSIGVLNPDLTFVDGDVEFAPFEADIVGGLFTYAVYRPDFITITSPPTADQMQHPLVVVVALSVSDQCLEIDANDWQLPDWMWDMFFTNWFDGLCSKLFSMPAKPWSNEKLAVYHGKRWRNAMAFRKQEANRGFVYGSPGWRFRKW